MGVFPLETKQQAFVGTARYFLTVLCISLQILLGYCSPTIKSNTSSITVHSGDTASITCTVSGVFNPHRNTVSFQYISSRKNGATFWIDDENDQIASESLSEMERRKYTVYNATHRRHRHGSDVLHHVSYTLNVYNTSKTDIGTYRCVLFDTAVGYDIIDTATVYVTVSVGKIDCGLYPRATNTEKANSYRTVMYCYTVDVENTVELQWINETNYKPVSSSFYAGNQDNVPFLETVLSSHELEITFQCRAVETSTGAWLPPCRATPLQELVSITPVQFVRVGQNALYFCNTSLPVSAHNLVWAVTDKDGVTVFVRKTIGRYKLSLDHKVLGIENVTLLDHKTTIDCIVTGILNLDIETRDLRSKGVLFVINRHKTEKESFRMRLTERNKINPSRQTYTGDNDNLPYITERISKIDDKNELERFARDVLIGREQTFEIVKGSASTEASVSFSSVFVGGQSLLGDFSYEQPSSPHMNSIPITPVLVGSLILFSIVCATVIIIVKLLSNHRARSVGKIDQIPISYPFTVSDDILGTLRRCTLSLRFHGDSGSDNGFRASPVSRSKYVQFLESTDDVTPQPFTFPSSEGKNQLLQCFSLDEVYFKPSERPHSSELNSLRLSVEGQDGRLMNAVSSSDFMSSSEFCYRSASEKVMSNLKRGHSRVTKGFPKSKSTMKEPAVGLTGKQRNVRSPQRGTPTANGSLVYTEIDWERTVTSRGESQRTSERTVYALVNDSVSSL
ncbi:hypothetical protein BSL78_19300 [Apostichopus japonicus]|uniref:Ig-like domain-containing protein n=1 Tax=Stichopus japonicus TaxID=307972 RepID=A0A2G8K7B8_STIJA|nr:hypothetical protein BSL78_19300 [Apostichopus japonicus]